MKIVIIHGQNHKGSTYHISRMLSEKLAINDDIIEFFLPKDLNHFCKGCYQCIEDERKCPYYSDKKHILDAMEQSELFIFATPNYCMAPSAPMKSLLDLFFDYWMTHRPKEWMFSKKAVVISTTAGMGANASIKIVKKSLLFWGIPYIKSYGVSVQAMNWNMVKSKKKEKIEVDINKLAKKIDKVGMPKTGIKSKFIFNMMANMHGAGWDASPTEKQYWEKHGWLGKTRPWRK